MDKNKVIELIKKGMLYQSKSSHVSSYKERAKNCFKEALNELQKSDWISVEDELPPIGMRVWVCNIKNPDVVVSDYRSHTHICNVYDGYGFLIGNHVTHWRKIDKLEV